MKIAIVVSQFNQSITDQLLQGALDRLKNAGVDETNITVAKVPGAVEIPFTAQLFAKTKQYQAIIGLGAVIRGETNHYDYVCQQVSFGFQRVMLEQNTPVIFGVLTTDTEEQAQVRASISQDNKGAEFADAALQMMKVVKEIGI